MEKMTEDERKDFDRDILFDSDEVILAIFRFSQIILGRSRVGSIYTGNARYSWSSDQSCRENWSWWVSSVQELQSTMR